MIKSIYINLPIKDIQQTLDFWSKLGFSFNEQFTDDKAICLELQPPLIYAMLIKKELFSTFTNRSVADGKITQVLLAIEVESKNKVDELIAKAMEAGAERYRIAEDHGWMYSDTFSDIDGHQWEVMFMDESLIPND